MQANEMNGVRLLMWLLVSAQHNAWGSAAARGNNWSSARSPQLPSESLGLSVEDIRTACFADIEADSQALNLVQAHARKALIQFSAGGNGSNLEDGSGDIRNKSSANSTLLPAVRTPQLDHTPSVDPAASGANEHSFASANAPRSPSSSPKPPTPAETLFAHGPDSADLGEMDFLSLGQVGASYSFATPSLKTFYDANWDGNEESMVSKATPFYGNSTSSEAAFGNTTSVSSMMAFSSPKATDSGSPGDGERSRALSGTESGIGSPLQLLDGKARSLLNSSDVSNQSLNMVALEEASAAEMASVFDLEEVMFFFAQRWGATIPGLPHVSASSNESTAGAEGESLWCDLMMPPLRVEVEALRHAGYMPQRKARSPSSLLSTWVGDPAASSMKKQVDAMLDSVIEDDFAFLMYVPTIIVLCWAVFLVVLFLYMMSNKFAENLSNSASGCCKLVEESRALEVRSWESGMLHWLTIGWGTAWVAKWGHECVSTEAEVGVEELGPAVTKDETAEVSYRRIEALWKEEVEVRGLANASLGRVLVRFIGAAQWTKLFICAFLLQMTNNVATVLAVGASFSSYQWLTDPGGAKVEATRSELIFPLALMLFAFTGVPLIAIGLESLWIMVAGKTDMRLDGALCMMVYSKKQRLPAGAQAHATDAQPAQDAEEEAAGDPAEAHGAEHMNALQLVNTDIKASLTGLLYGAMTVILVFPFGIFLVLFLMYHIGFAFLYALFVALPMLALMQLCGSKAVSSRKWLENRIDHRLNLCKETFSSIRLIKACGWEKAHLDKISEARAAELCCFGPYFDAVGKLSTVGLALPAVMTLATAGSCIWVIGSIGATQLFVILQALGHFQALLQAANVGITRVMRFMPAIGRLEAFLKLDEAPPLCLDRQLASAVPDAAGGRPACDPLHPLDSASSSLRKTAVPRETASLRLSGDFAWRHGGDNVLHDVQLQVPRGRAVAVVGSIGSGKSTLLQALLGELDGGNASQVDVPGPIAYCAQRPWLVDGTLRDNIICNDADAVDNGRYSAALSAASLLTDIKVWSDGDKVQVGTGGVTLSGGQQSRVALARAMYSRHDAVLLDDPFASLDVQTSEAAFEEVINGPLMQGRTRIVVLQPTKGRLERFDDIIVMSGGRIVKHGASSHVLHSDECQALLLESPATDEMEAVEAVRNHDVAVNGYSRRNMESDKSRTDCEPRSRSDGRVWLHYFRLADKRALAIFAVLCLFSPVLHLTADMQLAIWANDIEAGTSQAHPASYFFSYAMWQVLGKLAFFFQWPAIAAHAYKVSQTLFLKVIESLMSAGIVSFHDRNPVGVVMQRLSQEMFNIDEKLPLQFAPLGGLGFMIVVWMSFAHGNMPLSFTIFSLPMYGMIVSIIRGYYNTTVRIMLLERDQLAKVSARVSDLDAMMVSVRAYGVVQSFQRQFAAALDNQMKARLLTSTTLIGWCAIRVRLLLTFWGTAIAIICVLDTGYLPAGTFALCMINIQSVVRAFTSVFYCGSIFMLEFLSVQRLLEYTNLPPEAAPITAGDSALQIRSTAICLSKVGTLTAKFGDRLQVLRSDGSPLFEATADGLRLRAAQGVHLNEYLGEDRFPSYGYFVTAVNSESKDAESMAAELCRCSSQPSAWGRPIRLSLTTGWLVGGANVHIENLSMRYGSRANVINSINLSFTASQKIAIVGRSGSGKSTLLLGLLRMVEAHSGRIVVNGIDISTIGLNALRQALGLVPQSPVLFTGTIRSNLDPAGQHTDNAIWEALKMCKLDALVRSLPGELSHGVALGGENFSVGERQLLSLGRMVLRQPGLLLMDEATSAVDPHTQDQVHEAVNSVFAESTVISVVHRLESAKMFEYVVVFDNGNVLEKGSLNGLLSREDGYFFKMMAARSSRR